MKTLDLKETAQLLKMHPETLRRAASTGKIPAKKLGKKWVFLESALEDWFSRSYNETRRLSQVDEPVEVHKLWQQKNRLSEKGMGRGTRTTTSKVSAFVKALESQ